MSPRPYWKGYLKLSLVSCPIAVHAACSSSERISFRQINRVERAVLVGVERHRSGTIARSTARPRSVRASSPMASRVIRPLTTIVVTISPGIAVCFQSVLLATQNNSMRSLTLRDAAVSAGERRQPSARLPSFARGAATL
jgi:hypothetical protein